MTQNFTDVFGQDVVPPSEYGYQSLTLIASQILNWPFNNTANPTSKIMDISASIASLSLTLPSAMDVSVGEDMLFRNIGSQSILIQNSLGAPIVTVVAGAATYLYLTNNTTVGGSWGVVHYGVGTSSVDAASLVGYGIKAVAASLNQCHPILTVSTGVTVDDTHRAQLVNYTGGSGTIALPSASVTGDDFFTLIRNSGTGTLTINPNSSETVDGALTLDVQPGESLFLFCSGTAWFTVGLGRSIEYTFTQLILDVTTGSPITLTSAQAANKLLTFIGSPSAPVTVIVPNVVSVYYLLNSCSTNQNVTVKTATGFGANIPQNQRSIVISDGTNIYSAQSVSASSTVSLLDGAVTLPSLNFASQTNTGIYKYSTMGMGFAVNGVEVVHVESTGTTFSGTSPIVSAKIGPAVGQQHTLPAVASDTIALLAATQALTNKTISADSNTLSGIAASSFVLSNASGNLDGSAAQKVIPSGAVVGTTDSQALTNKTIVAASNTITTAASGNLAATELNAALAELESEKVAKAGDTMTGNLDVPSLNNGQLAGLRNKVINGAFQIWQRFGTFTAAGPNADMWFLAFDGTGGTREVTRGTHAAGYEIEGEPNYIALANTAPGTATYNCIETGIEDVRTFNGKTVTLSFWAKADANRAVSFIARQLFGSGGSGSVDNGTTTFNLTTAWQKFTHTFSVASIIGKTIGNPALANPPQLRLIFCAPLSACTINLANVQLELGSIATPFENRPEALEERLCMRYLEYINTSRAWSGYVVSGATYYATYYYKVPKRTQTPNIQTASSASNNGFGGLGTITMSKRYAEESRLATATQNTGSFGASFFASSEL